MRDIAKRLSRLEQANADEALLPVLTIDDCMGGLDPRPWPAETIGVRFADGAVTKREAGEALGAFRHRLMVEANVRGPAGSLPAALVALIAH